MIFRVAFTPLIRPFPYLNVSDNLLVTHLCPDEGRKLIDSQPAIDRAIRHNHVEFCVDGLRQVRQTQ